MEEVWKPSNRIIAICLYPLRLDASDNVLEDLQIYLDGVQAQVKNMLEKGHTWHMIESVDIVVIPVKVAGAWALYLTQRTTKQQSVLRVARMIRKVEASNRDAPGATFNLDKLMHTLGVSVMAIWLKSVVFYLRGEGAAVTLCRARAEEDIEAGYSAVRGTFLPADVMTPGVAIMYLIQGALLWDQNQPAQLITAYDRMRRADKLAG